MIHREAQGPIFSTSLHRVDIQPGEGHPEKVEKIMPRNLTYDIFIISSLKYRIFVRHLLKLRMDQRIINAFVIDKVYLVTAHRNWILGQLRAPLCRNERKNVPKISLHEASRRKHGAGIYFFPIAKKEEQGKGQGEIRYLTGYIMDLGLRGLSYSLWLIPKIQMASISLVDFLSLLSFFSTPNQAEVPQ